MPAYVVLGLCGGLNKNDPHRLTDLNVWSPGSDTIGRCGLVRVGVASLELHHLGGFWAQTKPSSPPTTLSPLLPVDQGIELPVISLEPCLPVCCHATCHTDNGLNP